MIGCGVRDDELLRSRIEVAEPNGRLGDGVAEFEEFAASVGRHLKGHLIEVRRCAVVGSETHGGMKGLGCWLLSDGSALAGGEDEAICDEEKGDFHDGPS